MSDEYEATTIFGYLALSTFRKLDLEIPLFSFTMFLSFSSYCFETYYSQKKRALPDEIQFPC